MNTKTNKLSKQLIKIILLCLFFNIIVLPVYQKVMDEIRHQIIAKNIEGVLDIINILILFYIFFLYAKKLYNIIFDTNQISTYTTLELKPLYPQTDLPYIKTEVLTEDVKAAHESGHWLMAELLNIPVQMVSIITGITRLGDNKDNDFTIDLSDKTDVFNMIKIYYAGITAEQILLGKAGQGCMGSDTADLEMAEILLKKYLLITGESELTLNFISHDTTEKIAALSKQIRQEVISELTKNKGSLEDKYKNLLEKKEVSLL